MTSTKAEILALLKRNGGHRVSELAASLNLAPVTIRQHLTHLQREGLVKAEQRSRPSGRPHYVFRLTTKAHAAAFPRGSDQLTELLVKEIGLLEAEDIAGRTPRQKTDLILERLAQRLAEEYMPLLRGLSLRERVFLATQVMHADGGFAEWEETGQGYEIRDFNCLFHRLLKNEGNGEVCEWHRTFLRLMLGREVQASPCPDGQGRCCRYVVTAAPSARTAGRAKSAV